MSRLVRRRTAAFLCLALALHATAVGPALAHQQKEAVTRVLFNPRTDNVEVMHRFLVHDVEHALEAAEGRPADVLGSEADRARFAAYVHERFAITDGAGDPLALAPVGSELDGKYLWVYAEAPIRPGLDRLLIRHGALRDVWRDQVNLVNVERNGVVRSAVFSGATQEAMVDFGED